MYMTRLINLLLPGDTFFFSRYPSVALARNKLRDSPIIHFDRQYEYILNIF